MEEVQIRRSRRTRIPPQHLAGFDLSQEEGEEDERPRAANFFTQPRVVEETVEELQQEDEEEERGEGHAERVEEQVEAPITQGVGGEQAVGAVVEEEEEGMLPLAAFLDPDIPGAEPFGVYQEMGEGWCAIDRLTPEQCFFSTHSSMEEVPRQHRHHWAWAWGIVLERISNSTTDKERERALKWLLFLSQALLRSPGAKGQEGRGIVAGRFNCLVERRWGELVVMWEEEGPRARGRGARSPDTEEEEKNRLRRQVLGLLSKGNVGKAVAHMTSNGVADLDNPMVREQLEQKHPPRGVAIQHTVVKESPMEHMRGLRAAMLALRAKKGSSPGVGGCRAEFLVTLAEVLEAERMQLLEEFCLQYLRSELPPWFYQIFLSTRLVGLWKDEREMGVRPLGIRHPLARTIHRVSVTANRQEFIRFLEPQQLAMSLGGCTKLFTGVKMLLEHRRDFVCAKLDCSNAFSSCSRARVVRVLESEPTLRHLASHVATILAAPTILEDRGRRWGVAEEGECQGDPWSAALFCTAWQEQVEELDRELKQVGGMARCLMDDVYPVGPPDTLFPALQRFEASIQAECGLVLQRVKCQVFSWSGELPDNTIPGFTLAGTRVGDTFHPGFICVGAPIGSDEYVKETMKVKVEELRVEVEKVMEVLGEERQGLWAVLHSSFAHKLEYWLTLVHPSLIEDAARNVDSLLHSVLEKVAGSHLPQQSGYLTCACCSMVEGFDPGIPGFPTTYQHLTTTLPLKLGGFGMRSQLFLSPFAYYGGVEQSLPYFSTVCPPLAHLYDEERGADTRWEPLLNSNTRTGRELRACVEKVKEEALTLATYLGTEVPSHHSSTVEGMGEGKTDGSTRALLVREAEVLRAKALDKVLEELPNRGARPRLVRRNTDKISTSFLLSKPGPHSGLAANFFAEQMLALLAVPLVLCRRRVGERVGNMVVDKWADSVLNATLGGGHNMRGHNILKNTINSLFRYCGILSEVEPYGTFGDLIPQQPLNRAHAYRARQAIIPDIRAELPDSLGGTSRHYIEVKTVSGVSWYKLTGARAVERRVLAIATEYRTAARVADMRHHGTEDGPITQRLATLALTGAAFGRFCEASETVQKLVAVMAKARVEQQSLAWGRGEAEEKAHLSTETGFIRRRLSCAAVTAFGQRLVSRMSQVGGQGGQLASQRRQQWSREEERARVEREAAWMATIHGKEVVRRGRFWAS